MRLLRNVERLERGAADAAVDDARRWCVVWTGYDSRLDAGALRDGEYLAVDVRREAGGEGAVRERLTERVTVDAQDLGRVYTEDGRRVGRVVSIDGDLVKWELDVIELPIPGGAPV